MIILRGIVFAALVAFQIFSLTQLWSAWATGAIYVRKLGMIPVSANHAAYTQHMALYIIGALSIGYIVLRLRQWRKQA
ncbi:MAG: hypothetical protein ACRCTD_00225 [Beijerinckiaceae bacterium]